ncbi:MAG: hypothetical protein Q7V62_12315 [Actinomycetota bacterium]|nr:hypothetical protein [Actinomycetota bacterium]
MFTKEIVVSPVPAFVLDVVGTSAPLPSLAETKVTLPCGLARLLDRMSATEMLYALSVVSVFRTVTCMVACPPRSGRLDTLALTLSVAGAATAVVGATIAGIAE